MASYIEVPVKLTSEVDLVKPIKKYIESTYSNFSGDSFEEPIKEFNKLRNLVVTKQNDKHESVIEIISRYYDQLCAVEKRLPFSDSEISVKFKWKESFSGKKSQALTSSGYERMCVLFNVASLHSQVAATQMSNSDESMKKSVKFFQISSGIFGEIKDVVETEIPNDIPLDLTPDTLSMLSSLMLAQAQETLYYKAVSDKVKNTSVSKLAYGCSELYADALKLMQLTPVRDIIPRDWTPRVAMKQAAFHSLSEYHQSLVVEKSLCYGEVICRLQRSLDLMQTAQNRGASQFTFTYELNRIQESLERVRKDNDVIYHEKVPNYRDIAAIGKVLMVKPTPVSKPLNSSFIDLFSTLVPVDVLTALNSFKDRKSVIVNLEVARMQEATRAMDSVLASLNLPTLLDDLSDQEIPESIIRRSNQIQEEGGVELIDQMITEMPGLLKENQNMLDEIFKQLDDEETTDTQLRGQYGTKWTPLPSTGLNSSMKEQAEKFHSVIIQALNADRKVSEKYTQHRPFLMVLSGPKEDLKNSLQISGSPFNSENFPAFSNLKELMIEVNGIRMSRADLEVELREATFDMTSIFTEALVQDGAIDEESLSSSELNHVYGDLRNKVSESLTRQEALLNEIQDSSKKFHEQMDGSALSRINKIKEYSLSYDAFSELRSNLVEGSKFYKDLVPLLAALHTKVSEWCCTRKIEQTDLQRYLNKSNPQFTQNYPAGPVISEGQQGDSNSPQRPPRPPPPKIPTNETPSDDSGTPTRPARPAPPRPSATEITTESVLDKPKPVPVPRSSHQSSTDKSCPSAPSAPPETLLTPPVATTTDATVSPAAHQPPYHGSTAVPPHVEPPHVAPPHVEPPHVAPPHVEPQTTSGSGANYPYYTPVVPMPVPHVPQPVPHHAPQPMPHHMPHHAPQPIPYHVPQNTQQINSPYGVPYPLPQSNVPTQPYPYPQPIHHQPGAYPQYPAQPPYMHPYQQPPRGYPSQMPYPYQWR